MNLWPYLPRSIYSVLLVLHLFNFEIFCCKTVMLSDSILQEDIHTCSSTKFILITLSSYHSITCCLLPIENELICLLLIADSVCICL